MSKKANPPPPVPTRGALVLLVLGLAECALSVFQWSQLITLRNGGTTVCSVSEHVNCEMVWNTPFASRVHELLGIPVAGLGLLWGLVATVLAGLYLTWSSGGQTVRPAVNGLRLTAAAGVLSTVVFASVSVSAGALCLTCLGTYVLVHCLCRGRLARAAGPPGAPGGRVGTHAAVDVGIALAGFIALSIPGRATPKALASSEEQTAAGDFEIRPRSRRTCAACRPGISSGWPTRSISTATRRRCRPRPPRAAAMARWMRR